MRFLDNVIGMGLLYGAGIVVAFLALLGATPRRQSRLVRRVLFGVAWVALLLQGGCWTVAAKVGQSTSGSDEGPWKAVLMWSVVVAFVWSFLIFWAELRREKLK